MVILIEKTLTAFYNLLSYLCYSGLLKKNREIFKKIFRLFQENLLLPVQKCF